MEQVGLHLCADLFSDKNAAPAAGSGDPAGSMFRSLLERSTGSNPALSHYEERRRAGMPEDKAGTLSGSVEGMIQRVGLPVSQLRLPRSAVPELVSLLEGQGLQKGEIRALLAVLSEKDGSIRMDKLLARLQSMDRKARDGNGLLMEGKEIPQLGEALMALGIGAGRIKEIIEASQTRKGELSIERLSSALSQISPGIDAKSLLTHILDRAQIQARQKTEARSSSDPDVQRLLQDLSAAQGEDGRKEIRKEIGRLMRERGIPPQEVKSFLETLTPSQAGALAKKTQAAQDPGGRKAEAGAEGLMEKVVLDSTRRAPQEDWKEKILQLLQKERMLGKGQPEKPLFPEEALNKPNPAEQKVLEPKTKAANLIEPATRTPEAKAKPLAEHPEPLGSRKERTADTKPASVREGVTADMSAVRVQKEGPEVAAALRAKETVALPEPLPKVLDRMLWMIQGGEQKGRIHISPPELGRLDLDLVIKNGHLQARVNAESPQVKDLLDANLHQLKQRLAEIGLTVDRFEVSVGLEQNPFAKEQAWTAGNRRGRSSGRAMDERGHLQVERGAAAEGGRGLTQVDMLV